MDNIGKAKNEYFNDQFDWDKNYWVTNLDFQNWYRYYFIVKEVIGLKPKNILEIGEGSGVVKNVLDVQVEEYKTMDVNKNLNPDFLGDIREHREELLGRFDCVVIADVLEHLPFGDLEKACNNLASCLKNNGKVITTIPHRASHFLISTPFSNEPVAFRVPTGFLSLGSFYRRFIKRKIWIDPYHEWEIGDGHHGIKDVEAVFKKVGFQVEKFKKLVYVDFWVLNKK